MARNNMNFKVTLELGAKQFASAVRKVESMLNGLKMQFMGFAGAIAGGAGLANLGRDLIDAAKRMDQAQTTLKNVSGGNYARNQEYLIRLAKDYNQEIITLTGNFSKFHASSNEANVALEDQKKIFESLTRASAYFNLSTEETDGVFLAVTQMMSKGKVSAEELRRQLGERLPGAFGLMAKAAGMTTAELDTALRQGKLMAADVLPKFADELNRVTQNLDIDTIQGWSNRLKTAVVNLSQELNIEGIYKSVVKFGARSVDAIGKNIKTIQNLLVGLGTSMAAVFVGKKWIAHNDYYAQNLKNLKYYRKEYVKYGKELEKYEKKYGLDFQYYSGPENGPSKNVLKDFSHKYPNFSGKMNLGFNEVSGNLKGLKMEAKDRKRINEIMREGVHIAESQRKATMIQARSVGFLQKLWLGVKSAAAAILPQAVITAAITGISMIISKTIQLLTAASKVRREYEKMNKEWAKFQDQKTPEMALLEKYKDELNRIDSAGADGMGPIDMKKRMLLISAINDLLKDTGTEQLKISDTNEHINSILDKRISLMKEEKNSAKALEEYTEAYNKKDELQKRKAGKQAEIDSELSLRTRNPFGDVDLGRYYQLTKELEAINAEIEENDKVMKERTKHILPYNKELQNKATQVENDFNTIRNNFEKEVERLKVRLKDGAITQEKYNDAIKNLAENALDQMYNIENVPDTLKDTFEAFKKQLIKIVNTGGGDPIGKYLKEFKEKQQAYNNLLDRGEMSLEEYDENMGKLVESVRNNILALDKVPASVRRYLDSLEDYISVNEDRKRAAAQEEELMARFDPAAGKEYNDWVKGISDKNLKFDKNAPVLHQRDSRFDYEKNSADINSEEAQIWKDYAESLRTYLEEAKSDPEIIANIDELSALLEKATMNASNFQDAADLAKINEDIKELRKNMNEGILDSVSGIASAMDRLQNAVEKISDPDISGFERMLAILNMLIQTTETLMQTMQMFEAIKKTIDGLNKAEKALAVTEAATTSASLAASGTKIAANAAEGTSAAAAGAAKLPFPASLVAIAAAIAGAAALFATIPKFASGGIVGGNSKTGDKILARLNSGEMILNKGQQASLLNQMNGGGGQVQFKVRGQDLVGVLNNYQKKITK